MKRILTVILVSVLFASLASLAIVFYNDDSPNPKECKTCPYKVIVDN